MKLLVAILVVVVQAAGPWLCCCAPARLVAKVSPRARSAEAPACPHCQAATKEPVSHSCCDSASQPRPKPKPSDCCKSCGAMAEPDPVVPTPITSVQNLPETPGEYLTVAELGLTSLATALATSEEHPPPFLSVETKLFTHHVLRC